jgi:prepilin-type N-terminal cleavage/methylation domain-containing protein
VCRRGFTVLELLITLSIMALVAALLFPALSIVQKRAQRILCSANLRSLHVAAAQFVQDNNHWPQIGLESESDSGTQDYASEWIAALTPYGIGKKTWICPTIQSLIRKDFTSVGNERVDYIAMPFDDKPLTPYQWPRQPWFVESADVHGHGNLIIFTDGSITDLTSLVPKK